MRLFLQLDLNSLPGTSVTRSGDGILQLFYCTSSDWTNKMCPAEDSSWEPFSKGKLVRVVRPGATVVAANRAPGGTPFPEKVIVEWERFDDFPSPVEHDELGLKYDYDFKGGETFTTVEWPEQGMRFEHMREPGGGAGIAESIGRAAGKDKLGGWPDWIQHVEYPNCPQCGQRMEYIFQVDSEDHIPYMFGDVGCGHITRCREHRDVLGFGWACS